MIESITRSPAASPPVRQPERLSPRAAGAASLPRRRTTLVSESPVTQERDTAPGATPTAHSESEFPGMTPVKRRVLVVDDFFTSAEGLAEQLEHWGYEARAAASAEEGLGLLPEFRPDIIVSDLVMPGLSGIEFLVRLEERARDLVFIVLTGQGTIET